MARRQGRDGRAIRGPLAALTRLACTRSPPQKTTVGQGGRGPLATLGPSWDSQIR
jgi:hypothetical protein